MATTSTTTFTENINHIAKLDNSLGMSILLGHNNVVLNTSTIYSMSCTFHIHNRATNITEAIAISGTGISASGLNAYLATVKSQIEVAYPSCVVTHSVTTSSSSTAVFNDASLSVVTSGSGYYIRDINIKINDPINIKYSIDGELITPLELTPKMLELTPEIILAIDNAIDSMANIATITTSLVNINSVATNIASINTVAGIQNIANITTVANDLNSMDLNGIADVTIVANDLILGLNSKINIVSSDIVNVDLVASNIANINLAIDSVAATAANLVAVQAIQTSLANGRTWFFDAIDPLSTTGIDGDFAHNSISNYVFKKVAGAWVFQSNLTGNGIASITRTTGNGLPGTTDVYTVDYTNIASTTFSVYNGVDGAPAGTAGINQTSYIATALQTSFDIVYEIGYINVFRNGRKLTSSDFTAISGTNIVLTAGAQAGDTIECVGYVDFLVGTSAMDWVNILNKPLFSTVANTGSYTDLINKPTIPVAYTLPVSDAITLGGVKVGANLSIDVNGVLSANAQSVTVDLVPTDASTNAVSSNGVYDALVGKSDTGHTHAYEPIDATILRNTAIGSTVQGYNVNTTTQGNTFNGASQLVKLDALGKLPAVDGSQLTNLPSGGSTTLDGLTDATILTPTNGQVLTYNSTTSQWVNAASTSGSSLDGLSDVVLTTPATSQILQYNGTNWVNATNVTGISGVFYSNPSIVAAAGQTIFSVTYDIGSLDVYMNGLKLDASDYTAINGTSFTLATAATLGDVVSVAAYKSFSIADTYTRAYIDTLAAYTHPTGDGNLHVPATSTTSSGKVLTAGATAGSISWQTPATGAITMDALTDVTITTPLNGHVLQYNTTTSQWVNTASSVGVTDHTLLTSIGTNSHSAIDTALARLVNTSGTNTGDETISTIKTKLGITTLSGSNTGDQDLSAYSTTSHTHTVDGLSDAVITTPASGQVLTYNGTQWVNSVVNSTFSGTLTATGATVLTLDSASSIVLDSIDGTRVVGGPLRLPQLTTTQRNALAGQNGDCIYNTTTHKVQVVQNGTWLNLDGTAL